LTSATTLAALTCFLLAGAAITAILGRDSVPAATAAQAEAGPVANRASKQDKLAVAALASAAFEPAQAAEAPAAPTPPAPEESVASSAEVEPEVVESFDPRISIPESLGPVRRAVLEGLLDGEGPMSVAQLHALMPVGTPRGTAEAGILREFRSGRILRTSPGHYALAPARPPEAKRPFPPPLPTPDEEAMWFSAFDAWISEPETWDRTTLGPRPNEPGRRIPADIVAKGVDRSRKREARRREAEAAATARAAADAELRDPLIAATGGNLIRGPGIEDVSPIQLALQVVPIGRIVSSIRSKTDKKLYPRNEPATSWRERRLLKAIAEDYCSSVIVPSLVAAWEAAGKTPGKPVERVAPSPAISAPATEETAPAAPPTQSNGAEFLNAEISGIIKTARHPGSAEDVSPDTVVEPGSLARNRRRCGRN